MTLLVLLLAVKGKRVLFFKNSYKNINSIFENFCYNGNNKNRFEKSMLQVADKNDIETELTEIFENDRVSDVPVVLFYKPESLELLAKFISGEIDRSMAIGIAGESASGKSTIAREFIETIENFAEDNHLGQVITRVNTDDYYYDRSEQVKKAGSMAEFVKTYDLDVPEALELDLMFTHVQKLLSGNSVMLPKYDMSGTTIRWDNHTLAEPSKIIISEGLFALTEKIRGAFDFKVYVDIDSEIQKNRFFARAEERKLGDSAKSMYKNVSQKAEIYIKPRREVADIVLSGAAPISSYRNFLNKILSVVAKLYLK